MSAFKFSTFFKWVGIGLGSLIVLIVLFVFYQNLKLDKNSININGIEREFYVSETNPSIENPKILIFYHSSGMNVAMQRAFLYYKLESLAADNGFVLIYPSGIEKRWRTCRRYDDDFFLNNNKVDDVAFSSELFTWVEKKYKVSTQNIFIAGFSNGGNLVYTLNNVLPNRFNKAVVFAASLPVSDNDVCPLQTTSNPILIFAGTKDPINPWEGGEIVVKGVGSGSSAGSRGYSIGMQGTLEKLKNIAGYENNAITNLLSENVTQTTYQESGKPTISLVKLDGFGHTIPHPDFAWWPPDMGKVNKEINSLQMMLDFFKEVQQ